MGVVRWKYNDGPSLLRILYTILLLSARPNVFGALAVAKSSSRDLDQPINRNTPSASYTHHQHQQHQQQQQNPLSGNRYYCSEAIENILPHHSFRNNNVAVIIETDPAKVPQLVPIMLHFASTLGPDWPILLLTLQRNWDPAAPSPASMAFRQLLEAKRIVVLFLPPHTAFPDHRSVTYFLVRPWLWQLLTPANRVLMFQVDSILCAQSTHTVDDFLEWDFIGAPIGKKHGHGYNGGLSIRNPRLFLEIAREQQRDPKWLKPEDQWFYERLLERGSARLPTEDEAKLFAVETVYYHQPLGYHQPARWQKQRMPEITKWCPEVQMLAGGQHFF